MDQILSPSTLSAKESDEHNSVVLAVAKALLMYPAPTTVLLTATSSLAMVTRTPLVADWARHRGARDVMLPTHECRTDAHRSYRSMDYEAKGYRFYEFLEGVDRLVRPRVTGAPS